ncbi:hypothetical protein CEP54_009081 [Fusarium duplospermum]|uniref:Uncharacterized protein n=1 Tax=Fusarium duplospermum TaxID=1325734 RepID=A0A428PSG1_9HYPO|nr:hypothetical protein CEP54_009081 [Fusarium duplospermum]
MVATRNKPKQASQAKLDGTTLRLRAGRQGSWEESLLIQISLFGGQGPLFPTTNLGPIDGHEHGHSSILQRREVPGAGGHVAWRCPGLKTACRLQPPAPTSNRQLRQAQRAGQ